MHWNRALLIYPASQISCLCPQVWSSPMEGSHSLSFDFSGSWTKSLTWPCPQSFSDGLAAHIQWQGAVLERIAVLLLHFTWLSRSQRAWHQGSQGAWVLRSSWCVKCSCEQGHKWSEASCGGLCSSLHNLRALQSSDLQPNHFARGKTSGKSDPNLSGTCGSGWEHRSVTGSGWFLFKYGECWEIEKWINYLKGRSCLAKMQTALTLTSNRCKPLRLLVSKTVLRALLFISLFGSQTRRQVTNVWTGTSLRQEVMIPPSEFLVLEMPH